MSNHLAFDVDCTGHPYHPDVARSVEVMCYAQDQGCTCTKEKGHEGDHVAHGLRATIMHTWENTDAKK